MTKERAPRKARADSKEQAVKTMIAATSPIYPPDDMLMRDNDMRIFNEIIAEFANVDWSAHTVRIAALLARTIQDMIEDQELLREEGSVVYNDRGNSAMNPRRTAVQGYSSVLANMRRTLALHATAGGNKGAVAKKTGIHKGQEADNPLDDNDDDLLNTPPPASLN